MRIVWGTVKSAIQHQMLMNPGLLFLAILFAVFALRRKSRAAAARRAEIRGIIYLATVELARLEAEAGNKKRHCCGVCYGPATGRCVRCKEMYYCSHKCQIIHLRGCHMKECQPRPSKAELKGQESGGIASKESVVEENRLKESNTDDLLGSFVKPVEKASCDKKSSASGRLSVGLNGRDIERKSLEDHSDSSSMPSSGSYHTSKMPEVPCYNVHGDGKISSAFCRPTEPSVSNGPVSNVPQCAMCYRPTRNRCSRCKEVHYCSAKCQIVHWRQDHKDKCQPLTSRTGFNFRDSRIASRNPQVEEPGIEENNLDNILGSVVKPYEKAIGDQKSSGSRSLSPYLYRRDAFKVKIKAPLSPNHSSRIPSSCSRYTSDMRDRFYDKILVDQTFLGTPCRPVKRPVSDGCAGSVRQTSPKKSLPSLSPSISCSIKAKRKTHGASNSNLDSFGGYKLDETSITPSEPAEEAVHSSWPEIVDNHDISNNDNESDFDFSLNLSVQEVPSKILASDALNRSSLLGGEVASLELPSDGRKPFFENEKLATALTLNDISGSSSESESSSDDCYTAIHGIVKLTQSIELKAGKKDKHMFRNRKSVAAEKTSLAGSGKNHDDRQATSFVGSPNNGGLILSRQNEEPARGFPLDDINVSSSLNEKHVPLKEQAAHYWRPSFGIDEPTSLTELAETEVYRPRIPMGMSVVVEESDVNATTRPNSSRPQIVENHDPSDSESDIHFSLNLSALEVSSKIHALDALNKSTSLEGEVSSLEGLPTDCRKSSSQNETPATALTLDDFSRLSSRSEKHISLKELALDDRNKSRYGTVSLPQPIESAAGVRHKQRSRNGKSCVVEEYIGDISVHTAQPVLDHEKISLAGSGRNYNEGKAASFERLPIHGELLSCQSEESAQGFALDDITTPSSQNGMHTPLKEQAANDWNTPDFAIQLRSSTELAEIEVYSPRSPKQMPVAVKESDADATTRPSPDCVKPSPTANGRHYEGGKAASLEELPTYDRLSIYQNECNPRSKTRKSDAVKESAPVDYDHARRPVLDSQRPICIQTSQSSEVQEQSFSGSTLSELCKVDNCANISAGSPWSNAPHRHGSSTSGSSWWKIVFY